MAAALTFNPDVQFKKLGMRLKNLFFFFTNSTFKVTIGNTFCQLPENLLLRNRHWFAHILSTTCVGNLHQGLTSTYMMLALWWIMFQSLN